MTERRAGEGTQPAESAPAPGPETAQFLVRLDLANLEETTGTLRGMGIDFDPVDCMICLPPDMAMDGIFTGQDMERVIRGANRYLEKKGESHRIREEEFRRMPPATRRDLIALLTLHTDWVGGERLNYLHEGEWAAFREKHPEAVTEEA